MSAATPTLKDRLTAVRDCVSSESLTALYTRNAPLPAPANTPTAAYLNEEVARGKVREAVASHLLCPAEVLKQGMMDSSRHVRAVVASVATSGVILNRLAMDCEAQVRERVASNLSTHPYLLRVLSDDSDPLVRLAADSQLGDTGESFSLTLLPLAEDTETASSAPVNTGEVVRFDTLQLAA